MTKYRYIIQSASADDTHRDDNDQKSQAWKTECESNNHQCLLEHLLTRLNEDEDFSLNTWFRLLDTKTNTVTNF